MQSTTTTEVAPQASWLKAMGPGLVTGASDDDPSGIGPMFGQPGFFHKFAGKDYEDKRPRDRYATESKRLLAVLDGHLKGRAWMLGDEYSIADIAIFPWVRNLVGFYGAAEIVGFDRFAEVKRVLDAFVARPAVQRGLEIPKKEG